MLTVSLSLLLCCSLSLCMLPAAHMTVDISGKDVDEMLNEKVLGKKLHISTAAHKPTHYNFGGDKDWSEKEFEEQEEEDDEFRD